MIGLEKPLEGRNRSRALLAMNNLGIDLLDRTASPLGLNSNPRNGLPYFNPTAFNLPPLGTPGTASRRSFYGPGTNNWDIALLKTTQFAESRSVEFRFETFNTFNHAQFFGANSVDGNINSSTSVKSSTRRPRGSCKLR